jgi:UDP-N-acetylmuramoylalanine--D-glutamate ligase
METVGEIRGVRYVNDTTATTPDATVAALRSLPARSAVLIAGGTDKELEFRQLAREIAAKAKACVFLPGTATDKLKKALGRARIAVVEAGSMVEAVRLAATLASRGDTVLLSPGAASFGLFRNEFDRGERFVAAVKRLR